MTAFHDYGQAFALLKENANEAWRDYTRHDFVEGLKNGSLSKDNFLHYLKQDYIFLIHFSRAWGLAIAKSQSLDEMKAAATTVDALVNHEMALHVTICEAAGISESELLQTVEEAENMAYTRYVLEAGYSGDWLDLLAALLPCVLGYGEIGKRLKTEKTSDTYQDWIKTYSDDEYQDVCHSVGKLFDEGLKNRLGDAYQQTPRWQALNQIFLDATRLEVGFWTMGMRG